MSKFETSKTYQTRSICDNNCIFEIEVIKRTAKTITALVHGKEKTLRIKEWEGVEQVKPFGSYSMCPVISAA
jgi:hypothetical protein